MINGTENTIGVYDGMIYGFKVSEYGLEKGYLDYQTLGLMVGDAVMNNTLRDRTMSDVKLVECNE